MGVREIKWAGEGEKELREGNRFFREERGDEGMLLHLLAENKLRKVLKKLNFDQIE